MKIVWSSFQSFSGEVGKHTEASFLLSKGLGQSANPQSAEAAQQDPSAATRCHHARAAASPTALRSLQMTEDQNSPWTQQEASACLVRITKLLRELLSCTPFFYFRKKANSLLNWVLKYSTLLSISHGLKLMKEDRGKDFSQCQWQWQLQW